MAILQGMQVEATMRRDSNIALGFLVATCVAFALGMLWGVCVA